MVAQSKMNSAWELLISESEIFEQRCTNTRRDFHLEVERGRKSVDRDLGVVHVGVTVEALGDKM